MATSKARKQRMTQSEIINHFAEKFAITRAEAKEFFDELGNLAQSEVKRINEFILPGFGKLVLAERKAREGRNPATGETIQIPAKTTLKFRVGKSLKDQMTLSELAGDPMTGDDPFDSELTGGVNTGDEP